MSLLNVESYVFINAFYLALFCIHVCVDDVIKKKDSFLKQKIKAANHTLFNYFVEGYKRTCIYKKHITHINQEKIINNNSMRIVMF